MNWKLLFGVILFAALMQPVFAAEPVSTIRIFNGTGGGTKDKVNGTYVLNVNISASNSSLILKSFVVNITSDAPAAEYLNFSTNNSICSTNVTSIVPGAGLGGLNRTFYVWCNASYSEVTTSKSIAVLVMANMTGGMLNGTLNLTVNITAPSFTATAASASSTQFSSVQLTPTFTVGIGTANAQRTVFAVNGSGLSDVSSTSAYAKTGCPSWAPVSAYCFYAGDKTTGSFSPVLDLRFGNAGSQPVSYGYGDNVSARQGWATTTYEIYMSSILNAPAGGVQQPVSSGGGLLGGFSPTKLATSSPLMFAAIGLVFLVGLYLAYAFLFSEKKRRR